MNYIGSKVSVIDFLDESIADFCDKVILEKKSNPVVFCDIFAGTGSVGKHFKKKGYYVIANDLQFYSYAVNKHYICNSEDINFEQLKGKGISDVFEYLNNLEGQCGYIYSNYSLSGTIEKEYQRLYFTDNNAKKIDAIRSKIEQWKNLRLLDEREYYYLIACLLKASDKVANTASVYEAFLKKIKKSAAKDIHLEPLKILKKGIAGEVYIEDANSLIKKISGDILYMDPPYNSRRYSSNYHILETISKYDNPVIKGKTGVRKDSYTSSYNSKRTAAESLEEMIKNAKFRYIFLSYNDEGIIPMDRIEEIMKKYGRYKKYMKSHKRFKSNNGRKNLKDYTIEYLYCVEKI